MKIVYPGDASSATLRNLIGEAHGGVLFIGDSRVKIEPGLRMFERMTEVMRDTGAGWLYSDSVGHPRIDYRPGSIRDNFDFGPLIAVSAVSVDALAEQTESRWGALYDLRLRISETRPVVRIPEPLYSSLVVDSRPTGQKQFDYVDPKNRDYQIEMERIAPEHLKRVGAWLGPRPASASARRRAAPRDTARSASGRGTGQRASPGARRQCLRSAWRPGRRGACSPAR